MSSDHETVLNEGLRLRSATMDDAASVAQVMELHQTRLVGHGNQTPDQVRDKWQNPGFDLEKDAQVVETNHGVIVGFITVKNPAPPYINSWISFCIHPDYLGQGIGTTLTRWATDAAKAKFHLAPDDALILSTAFGLEHETDTRQLLENEGFKVVRHWYQMRIDMDAPPPPAEFPETIMTTTHAELDDLLRIIRAEAESFQDHYGYVEEPEDELLKSWRHRAATDPYHDDSLWFLAMDGDEIAGFCLCQSGMDEDPEMPYVRLMAVRRAWRKQGIALNLLYLTFGKLYEQGIRKVSLHVDAGSLTGATRLYEKAGMTIYRRSDRYEKILRDGKDYRTVE